MRRLVPDVVDEDLADTYAELDLPRSAPAPDGADRPYVYLGMVASVDGTATLDGVSGPLGGEADRVAFRRLRETCDVILVGAGTVRTESYGPPKDSAEIRRRRTERGLGPVPRIAVATRSLSLDPDARLFGDPARRPVIVTVEEADPERRRRLAQVADVVVAGSEDVQPLAALRMLLPEGGRVLVEGGPSLNAQLVAAGVVDEVFLTVAPILAGGGKTILSATGPFNPRQLDLVELRHHDGELLLRYRLR